MGKMFVFSQEEDEFKLIKIAFKLNYNRERYVNWKITLWNGKTFFYVIMVKDMLNWSYNSIIIKWTVFR